MTSMGGELGEEQPRTQLNASAAGLSVEAAEFRVAESASAVSTAVAVSVGVTVATTVSATVATSVASTVATTVASTSASAAASGGAASAGGSVGSAGSGSAATDGGTSSGSVVPLILGAQRFVAYGGGLATNVSATQSAASGSLRWVQGRFGVLGMNQGRSFNQTDPGADLNDQLFTIALVLPLSFAVHLVGLLVWRFCLNRNEKKKFIPLPSALVFPNLLTLVVALLITGSVETASAVIASAVAPASDTSAAIASAWPGLVVLIVIVLYMLLTLAMIVHMHCAHRTAKTLWQRTVAPDSAKEVDDPLLRAMGRLLARCFACCGCKCVLERERGSFEIPAEMLAEPTRTNRLLATPYRLFRSSASDAHQALSLHFFSRARGSNLAGVSYDWFVMAVQLMLAALLGMGPSLQVGSAVATAQLVAVVGLQAALVLWLFLLSPGADRYDVTITAVQFMLEGGLTALLLLGITGNIDEATAQQVALILGLASMFLPMVLLVYDGFFMSIIRRVRQEETPNCLSWCSALLAVLLFVPSVLVGMLGLEFGGAGGTAISATEVTISVTDSAATEKDQRKSLSDEMKGEEGEMKGSEGEVTAEEKV